MKAISKITLLSLSVALAAACGAPAPEKTAPAPAPAATVAAAAPVAAAPAVAAAVGVAECDDFLTKYQACVDSKVPEAARAAFKQSMDQTKTAWQQAAGTPEGKAGLATACKQMLETSKTSLSAYSCSW
jgi:hypothetical protein